jgi:alanyl-tRNA synthetase
MPDNVGRGYVLRLILRRAIRFSKKINAPHNLMSSLVPVVTGILGSFFTDLPAHAARVVEVLDREEALFRKTLVITLLLNLWKDRGERIFQQEAPRAKDGVFAGDVAWKLYDTYGFPIDLTSKHFNFFLPSNSKEVMAEERGLRVDFAGYEVARQLARETSANLESHKEEVTLTVHMISNLSDRSVPATDDSAKFDYAVLSDGTYQFAEIKATVLAIVSGDSFVESVSANESSQVLCLNSIVTSGGPCAGSHKLLLRDGWTSG